jgi:peptidyl-prolyl cis-trans isomerase SurA
LILSLERWRNLLFTSVALATVIGGCNHQDSDKDVVAKVNSYKILRSEMDKSYSSQIAGAPQKPSPTEEQALRLGVLGQLIQFQLYLQKAEKLGIVATDDEVTEKVRQISAPYTTEEWQKKLKDQGLTEEDEKQAMRRNITIEKLFNKEIGSRVTISDSDIQNYYNLHKAEFNVIEPQYYMAEIFVGNQPSSQPSEVADKAQNDVQARNKIHMIYNRLESGEDFASLAARYSEDLNTARNGGEIGPTPESRIKGADPATRDAVLKLKAGQYTSPLVVLGPSNHQPIGYQILLLIRKEMAGQKELSDPAVQQLIRNQLRAQREQILKTAYEESLRDSAEVKNFYAEDIVKNAGQK